SLCSNEARTTRRSRVTVLTSSESPLDQQRTTERANPASLVSLYLLFMSFAVWARACTVASKLTRCLDAISLLAIAKAVQALTAPNAQRSMHGTCTYPATGSQVI